jgi:hypothetical protein
MQESTLGHAGVYHRRYGDVNADTSDDKNTPRTASGARCPNAIADNNGKATWDYTGYQAKIQESTSVHADGFHRMYGDVNDSLGATRGTPTGRVTWVWGPLTGSRLRVAFGLVGEGRFTWVWGPLTGSRLRVEFGPKGQQSERALQLQACGERGLLVILLGGAFLLGPCLKQRSFCYWTPVVGVPVRLRGLLAPGRGESVCPPQGPDGAWARGVHSVAACERL